VGAAEPNPVGFWFLTLKGFFIIISDIFMCSAYNTIKMEIVTIKYAKFKAHERPTVVEPMIVMFSFTYFFFLNDG
jgi:hypothetical protein